jgi:hypothetical protein
MESRGHALLILDSDWRKPSARNSKAALWRGLQGISAAEAQSLDELLVLLRLGRLQIVEESATLVDELYEPAARRMIALMGSEVLTQTIDTFGQERDLDFGRTGIRGPAAVLLDDPALFLSG